MHNSRTKNFSFHLFNHSFQKFNNCPQMVQIISSYYSQFSENGFRNHKDRNDFIVKLLLWKSFRSPSTMCLRFWKRYYHFKLILDLLQYIFVFKILYTPTSPSPKFVSSLCLWKKFSRPALYSCKILDPPAIRTWESVIAGQVTRKEPLIFVCVSFSLCLPLNALLSRAFIVVHGAVSGPPVVSLCVHVWSCVLYALNS